jgi:hypothetical protein
MLASQCALWICTPRVRDRGALACLPCVSSPSHVYVRVHSVVEFETRGDLDKALSDVNNTKVGGETIRITEVSVHSYSMFLPAC